MPTTSSRLGLTAPVGADFPSQYRLSIANHAATLDGTVRCFTGTLAARSSVTPADGDEYYATDTLLTYKWNGTVWQTMLLDPPPAGVAPYLALLSAQAVTITWGIASLPWPTSQFATPITVTHGLPNSRIPKLVLTGGDGGPAVSGTEGLNMQITNGVWNGSTFTLYGWSSVAQTNTIAIPWLVLG